MGAQTTRTWDGGSLLSNNWNTGVVVLVDLLPGLNWAPNGNPVAGDHLIFAGNNRITNFNNYAAGTAFGNLSFAAGAGAFTLNGNTITLNGSLTNNSTTTQTVNLGLILPGIRTFNAASGSLVINGAISGSGGIIKEGSNILTLNGTNLYTGATTINAGTLMAGSTQALGVNSAVTIASSGSAVLALNGFNNSIGSLSGGGSVTLGSGTLSVGGLGTNTVYSGIISGTGGGLAKTGGGTLTLEGNNTYTGATAVNAGTLRINGNQSLANGGVTVGPNGTLAGSGIIGGNTLINGGIHAPGNSPGVLSHLGNVTYNTGSRVQWELTQNNASTALQVGPSSYFDQIAVGGDLNFAGTTTMNLTFNAGSTVNWNDSFWDMWTVQDWLVYDVGGTISNFGNLALSNPSTWLDSTGESFSSALGGDLPSSAHFSLYQSNGNIYLRYEAVPEPVGFSVLALFLGLVTMLSRPRLRLD